MDATHGLLNLVGGNEFSSNGAIARHLTLRNLCTSYRDSGGRGWMGNGKVPELDGSIEAGQMCRLREFGNSVGYPVSGTLVSYECQEHASPLEMYDRLAAQISEALRRGMLWCPPSTIVYTRLSDRWASPESRLDGSASAVLDKVAGCCPAPLSAYSCHAFYEAQRTSSDSLFRRIFKYDSQVTPVTGVLGTLHNNTAVDMYVEEPAGMPDADARAFKLHFAGVICAGHTAHSQDAGISRRLACDVSVSLLGAPAVRELKRLLCGMDTSTGGPWTIFCMGNFCRTTRAQALGIWQKVRQASRSSPPSVTAYASEASKVLVLGVSTGTLLKLSSDGVWCTSQDLHGESLPHGQVRPKLDIEGVDQMRAQFSPYFGLIPFIGADRPPRPLMSSVQTQQAVCTPWSPGTAAVSPCYTFRPLVRTEMVNSIIEAIGSERSSVADEIPGFDACVCFANMAENYEDSVIVSRRFVDLGGFSSASLCSYLLPGDEYVPPSGTLLCSMQCRWWKSPCAPLCAHTRPQGDEPTGSRLSTGRTVTGRLLSSRITASGEVSVSVLSFAPLQTGDKLSTGHGQKGVSNILPAADMPFGITDGGVTVSFDIVMAISSITNRQTNGQVYEACAGVDALEQCSPQTSGRHRPRLDRDVIICDGRTGDEMRTVFGDDTVEVSRATYGFTRVFSQTQMVRERHHATHLVPGERSITAPTGRSRGGAVKLGEMEFQAMVSSGLTSCAAELLSRGNMVTCDVCVSCRRLSLTCQCDVPGDTVRVSMPHGTLVFDLTCAVTEGLGLEYDLEVG